MISWSAPPLSPTPLYTPLRPLIFWLIGVTKCPNLRPSWYNKCPILGLFLPLGGAAFWQIIHRQYCSYRFPLPIHNYKHSGPNWGLQSGHLTVVSLHSPLHQALKGKECQVPLRFGPLQQEPWTLEGASSTALPLWVYLTLPKLFWLCTQETGSVALGILTQRLGETTRPKPVSANSWSPLLKAGLPVLGC